MQIQHLCATAQAHSPGSRNRYWFKTGNQCPKAATLDEPKFAPAYLTLIVGFHRMNGAIRQIMKAVIDSPLC